MPACPPSSGWAARPAPASPSGPRSTIPQGRPAQLAGLRWHRCVLLPGSLWTVTKWLRKWHLRLKWPGAGWPCRPCPGSVSVPRTDGPVGQAARKVTPCQHGQPLRQRGQLRASRPVLEGWGVIPFLAPGGPCGRHSDDRPAPEAEGPDLSPNPPPAREASQGGNGTLCPSRSSSGERGHRVTPPRRGWGSQKLALDEA